MRLGRTIETAPREAAGRVRAEGHSEAEEKSLRDVVAEGSSWDGLPLLPCTHSQNESTPGCPGYYGATGEVISARLLGLPPRPDPDCAHVGEHPPEHC